MDARLEQAGLVFEKYMNIRPCRVSQLEGGFTNSSFLIETEAGRFVLRVPGSGTNEYINRPDEIENMHKLSVTGILPNVHYSDPKTGIIISEYISDNTPFEKKDIDDPEKLRSVCEIMSRLHKSGIQLKNEFDMVLIKDEYKSVLESMKAVIPEDVKKAEPLLDRSVQYLFSKYPKRLVSCHGDPKLNNFLLTDGKTYLIDWEYSGMADRYFDLVNLAMTNYLDEEQEKKCLQMYEQCYGEGIITEKYILYKIITDYLWLYWHLIKLNQQQMVEYNEKNWRNRLNRALGNLKRLGDI